MMYNEESFKNTCINRAAHYNHDRGYICNNSRSHEKILFVSKHQQGEQSPISFKLLDFA